MRFLVFFVLAACLSLAYPAASRADDLLCDHAPAGTVESVPAPFDHWLVLVCARQSQALVPIEGMMWFAHGTANPVSILALPPGTPSIPHTDEYNPSYSVRFTAFFATQAKDQKRERALKRLDAALAQDEPPQKIPKIDRVFQLDAVSSINDTRYNIYFYVAGTRPLAAIACLDECKQALFFDILTPAEASARLSGR